MTPSCGTESNIQKLTLLYVENAKVAAIFWEWRHKVLTHFFTAFAAITVVAGWFYERKELKRWLFVPLLLGAAYSVVVLLMDCVNKRMLTSCYGVGKSIEESLGPPDGAYTGIANRQSTQQLNYYKILFCVYLTGAVLLFMTAGLAIAFVH